MINTDFFSGLCIGVLVGYITTCWIVRKINNSIPKKHKGIPKLRHVKTKKIPTIITFKMKSGEIVKIPGTKIVEAKSNYTKRSIDEIKEAVSGRREKKQNI